MRTLLEMMLDKYEQAEVYKVKQKVTSLSYKNDSLKEIDNQIQSAVTLRAIDNGLMGYAFTRDQLDNKDLIKNLE